MINKKISPSNSEFIFKNVTNRMYGKEIDFRPVVKELSQLKQGGQLLYSHLNIISDSKIWPFHKWWRWPAESEIEESLLKTKDLFLPLSKLSKSHEARIDREKKIFNVLYYNIFKHLELTSIVLRFVDEENYAIYSPPIARFLNHPRGHSYATEYINYLGELRKYREIYGLPKVAQIDMFLWAVEILGDERKGIIELFHTNFEKSIGITAVNMIIKENIFGKRDLEKARFYLEVRAVDTAAKWAGCAFEESVRIACDRYQIKQFNQDRRKPLGVLMKELALKSELDKKQFIEIVEKRNNAFHPRGYHFTKQEVEDMISATQKIESI